MQTKEPLTLLDYYVELFQRRKILLINFFLTGIIALGIAFLLPKWYKATTTVLPPSNKIGGLLSGLTANLPINPMGLLGGGDDTFTYISILESNTLMEAITRHFNLTALYETEHIQETVKALRSNVDIEVNPEGIIIIDVYDQEAERAAEMANAFTFYLDSINTALKTGQARNNRIFLENRLTQNKIDLKNAEEGMRDFQEKNGAIALPEQTIAAVTAAAEVEGQIIATEVELAVQQKHLGPGHAQVTTLENTITELRKKLRNMKDGSSRQGENGSTQSDLFIPFKDIPELGVQYFRHLREVEVQTTIYKLLVQQYELAKLEESKQTPSVQVLDRAEPPYRKAKPKRAIIAIFAALSTTMLLAAFFCLNYRIRFVHATDPEKYDRLVSHLPFSGRKVSSE